MFSRPLALTAALALGACTFAPAATITVKEVKNAGGIFPTFEATTIPGERVTVSGTFSSGTEGVFFVDELQETADREAKRRGFEAARMIGWDFENHATLAPRFDEADAEAKRLGIDPYGMQLHVRATGRFRVYAPDERREPGAFIADNIEEMVVCPKHPAELNGCWNYP